MSALPRFRTGISSTLLPHLGHQEWPVLNPPTKWGPLNAPALLNISDGDLKEVTYEWASQVWEAWNSQDTPVHLWTQTLLEVGDRRYA